MLTILLTAHHLLLRSHITTCHHSESNHCTDTVALTIDLKTVALWRPFSYFSTSSLVAQRCSNRDIRDRAALAQVLIIFEPIIMAVEGSEVVDANRFGCEIKVVLAFTGQR
jgi:hypothetical protein